MSPKVVTAGWVGDQLGEPRLEAVVGAGVDQVADLVLEAAQLGARHAERGQAHGLALAHGDAAGDLRQVFAEGGGQQQPLHLAEALLGLEPRAPAEHLAQRLDVGREPGQAVRGGLRRVEAAGRRLVRTADLARCSRRSAAATACVGCLVDPGGRGCLACVRGCGGSWLRSRIVTCLRGVALQLHNSAQSHARISHRVASAGECRSAA